MSAENAYKFSGHLCMTRVPGMSDQQRRGIIIKMAEAGVTFYVNLNFC